jgi:hypothetical protein
MKDIGIITLLSVIISAAAPSSPGTPHHNSAKALTTAKSTDEFASCFTSLQDQGGLPWSYIRKADGGTFSNLGSRTVATAYFVVVSDRGSNREVRLEGNGSSEIAVNQAVNQCV